MHMFKTLAEVIAYITDREDTTKCRWNNAAGDWDTQDILLNASMYDDIYSEYTLDIDTYDIYDSAYKGGECLFKRIEDAQ